MTDRSVSRFWLPALFWMATTAACLWIRPSDVREYDVYAARALHSPILHAWPHEYPMLSLAVFLLPRLLPLAYRWGFAVVTGVALLVLMAREKSDPEWDKRLVVYLSVGAVGLFAGRYDIFPAAAAFFAVEAGQRQRFGAAWLWSVLGFLLKLFPAVLWPALLVAEWRVSGRWRWDRLVAAIGAGMASVAVQALFSRHAAFSSYRYFLHRPLQLGSLAAGLSASLQLGHFRLITSFGSINVITSSGTLVSVLITVFCVLAGLAVLALAVAGRINLRTSSLALLTILVLSSKVFSAQYVIWLIPLWAWYAWRWQWLLAAGLTTMGYPVCFLLAHDYGGVWLHWALWIDFCRDGLLLWGSIVWFLPQVQPIASRHPAEDPLSSWVE